MHIIDVAHTVASSICNVVVFVFFFCFVYFVDNKTLFACKLIQKENRINTCSSIYVITSSVILLHYSVTQTVV